MLLVFACFFHTCGYVAFCKKSRRGFCHPIQPCQSEDRAPPRNAYSFAAGAQRNARSLCSSICGMMSSFFSARYV